MTAMMTRSQICAAAGALGNQIRAGIPTAEAVRRMVMIQPTHAEFWERTASALSEGQRLSSHLSEVWPESLIRSVEAGEVAGRMPETLLKILDTVGQEMSVLKGLRRLAYPCSVSVVGLLIFLGYMGWVIAPLKKSMESIATKKIESSWVFDVAVEIREIGDQWLPFILVAVAVMVYAAISFFRSTQGQAQVLSWLISVPYIGPAISFMYFGLWAQYMALMTGAGIPTIRALSATRAVLPDALQAGVQLMHDELAASRTMADAATPPEGVDDDPRHKWPFYVVNAFLVAERTGDVEAEMNRCASPMLDEGRRQLEVGIDWATTIALAVAVFSILMPLALYLLQLLSIVKKV